jgi:hypothetical protein
MSIAATTAEATPKAAPKKMGVKTTTAVATKTAAPKADQIEGESIVQPVQDMIKDTVKEIENTKESKAFDTVPRLLNDIDQDYFKLGGYLSLIQNQGWFMSKGFETFKAWVEAESGLQYRKAIYLVAIYNGLSNSGVDWEKVKHLGWTKLKELASILTPENVDHWAAVAGELNVLQLIEHIRQATAAPKIEGEAATSDTTAKTVVTMTFKLHEDQKATVRDALAKAKHETGTDVDSVALEAICIDFLGGESVLKAQPTLKEFLSKVSAEEALNMISELHPDLDISVGVPDDGTEGTAQEVDPSAAE